MSDKPWRPVIVNPAAHFLNESYGITEERRLELSKKMDSIFLTGPTRVQTSAYMVDLIAELAETKEEYAYCLVVHVMLMQKKGAFL